MSTDYELPQSRYNSKEMRLFIKILKITVSLIIIIILGLFAASLLMQDKVAGYILKSLNNNISTKYEFESVRLSLLRQFPKASLDLNNVIVHSSPGFDTTGFSGIDTDTLLTAKKVFIEFSITDIYKGIYNIDKVGVKNGMLNLLTDRDGLVNYEISVKTEEVKNNDFTIDLNSISLSGIRTKYYNLATQLAIEGSINNGQLKSRISGKDIDFTAKSGMQITYFRLFNSLLSVPVSADIDISISRSDSIIVFKESHLDIDKYRFGLTGSISRGNILELLLVGKDLDIEKIKRYFPEELLGIVSDYNPSGLLQVRSNITGQLTRTSYPGIDIDFHLSDGSVTIVNRDIRLKDLSFDGTFTNGEKRLPVTSRINIDSFRGILGSTQYTGSLNVCNFDSLYGTLQLKGKVVLSEIKDFFRIKTVSSSQGSFDIYLMMKGSLPEKGKYTFPGIMDLITESDLNFNNFSIGIKDDKIIIDNVTGKLLIADSIIAENIHAGFKDHRFIVNGIFKNLPEWLAGRPGILVASAAIWCDRLVPELIFPSVYKSDNNLKRERAWSLPADIILDLKFNTDTFRFRKFKAEKIKGTLSYKPGLINFKNLDLTSLGGLISCNGFVYQNKEDRSFNTRGNFDFRDIDIKSAFMSFNNFGQDFIKAENINGKLSGSITVIIPCDSLLKADIKSVTAEGKYQIVDGTLIDFDPVKQLSSFIELSELENIRFEKLENDFFIRNNSLYIPQMDVNSTAADLSVNGKHGFDNDYEYHVRILLSEILSKKLKKPRPNTNEFGAVEDDGLGRTSVLLKIEDNGEDVRVSYDINAARNIVKEDIKAEKKTLRTILNEEYGWFKNDTPYVEKPPETNKPRFRILWDEADTTDNVDIDEPSTKKSENPLKNLFRKKDKN